MKKIAIFQRDLGMGGIQKSLVNLLNVIDYKKYEVDLYLFSYDNFFKESLPNELNIIYLKPLPYISRFIFFSILKIFHPYKIDKKYDLAIDYNSYDQGCALACLSVDAKEYISWVHNDVLREKNNDIKYRILHFFFKSKFAFFTKYVCVSRGLIEPFKKVNSISHNHFVVIPNLVLSEEVINKSMEKTSFSVDKSKYNLVSVGRLVLQKGFDILIQDMKEIIKKRKDIHLYIIGDGNQRKKLEKMVKFEKLDSYITFLGSQSNPFQYETLMDGFVLESRYEGQGIAFLEAKVLGLDLIIPSHLKNYIDDVEFTDDVCKKILSLQKKKKKKYHSLEEYNSNIVKKINQLFQK